MQATHEATPEWNGTATSTITTGAPVTATSAVFGASWTSPSSSDMLFFGVNGVSGASNGITSGASAAAASANFFGLKGLYSGVPTLAWSASFPNGGFDRSSVALSLDGTKVYAIDSGSSSGKATLHCMVASTGATCASWTDYQAQGQVHGSSPWVSYKGFGSQYVGDIYFGDDSGYVYHISASSGSPVWAIQPGVNGTYQSKFESSPVVANGYVYIGDDIGQVWRLTDKGPPAAGTSTAATFYTCGTAPCPGGSGGSWSIRTSVGYDVVSGDVFAVANDTVFELNGTATGGFSTAIATRSLNSGAYSSSGTGTPMQSSPIIDNVNGYVYVGYNSQLFKVAYPFTGSGSGGVYSTPLSNGTGAANPTTDALNYGGFTYIGDTGGYAERFDCTTQSGTPQIDGQTTAGFTNITAFGTLDYSTGNVNFGFSNGTSSGIVQYPLSGTYSCPGTQKLCTSSNGPANTCSGSSGNYGDACHACCVNADCPTTLSCVSGVCALACSSSSPCAAGGPNTTATCVLPSDGGTNGVCSYACTSGSTLCSGTLQTTGCTKLSSDPNNCGTCGTACSGQNIPVPTCTAGQCTGHCSDGFVHCTGTRQANGCETTASCGQCCNLSDGGPVVCGSGSTCYDNPGATGGFGSCVVGQTTQAYDSNSEHTSPSPTCPSGQGMVGITFADFGLPNGNPAQSWSTGSPCGSQTSSSACGALAGCLWQSVSSSCVAYSCATATTYSACTALGTGCKWAEGAVPDGGPEYLHNTTGTCTATLCTNVATSANCAGTTCAGETTSTACAADPSGACQWDTTQASCIPVCAWDTSLNLCTSSTGYLHNYGTYTGGGTATCAMDVSGSTYVTGNCSFVNSCTINAVNGSFTPVNGCTEGTSGDPFPLPSANCGGTTSPYYSDPCSGIFKKLELEVTCGTCGTVSAKVVFVTAEAEPGNYGSLANANALCSSDATAAGLNGTFRAWLSDGTATDGGAAVVASPTTGTQAMTHNTGEYVLPDGTEVAANWNGLTSGTLLHSINENANKSLVTAGEQVWTSTSTSGAYESGQDCTDWTSNSSSAFGGVGITSATNSTWTTDGTLACSSSFYYYCVQQ